MSSACSCPLRTRAALRTSPARFVDEFGRKSDGRHRLRVPRTPARAGYAHRRRDAVPRDDGRSREDVADPRVHGGLLAKRDNGPHGLGKRRARIEMIDMVVVNSTPFGRRRWKAAPISAIPYREHRHRRPVHASSVAKNFESVAVVTRPASYDAILAEMCANDGATPARHARCWRSTCSETTAAYDGAIAAWMGAQLKDGRREVPRRPHAASLEGVRLALRREPAPVRHVLPSRRLRRPCTAWPMPSASGQGAVRPTTTRPRRGLDGCSVSSTSRPLRHRQAPHALRRVPERDDPVEALRQHACDPVSLRGVMAFNRPVTPPTWWWPFDNKQFVEAYRRLPEFAGDALGHVQREEERACCPRAA